VVPLPHTVIGNAAPSALSFTELLEPVVAPPGPLAPLLPPLLELRAVPHVPDALPPTALVPLPHTFTGASAPRVPPLAELFDPVVAEPDPLPPLLELVPLVVLVAVPQVPVAEPPRASVPLPHKVTGASRPRKPPRPLLVEPT
jgi:hypothetical protein